MSGGRGGVAGGLRGVAGLLLGVGLRVDGVCEGIREGRKRRGGTDLGYRPCGP